MSISEWGPDILWALDQRLRARALERAGLHRALAAKLSSLGRFHPLTRSSLEAKEQAQLIADREIQMASWR